MKWKQQSGQFRLAPANRLPLSSPSPIYLVLEAKQLLAHRIRYHQTQCHTISHVAVLVESMKFIGRQTFDSYLRTTQAAPNVKAAQNCPLNATVKNLSKFLLLFTKNFELKSKDV